MLLTGICGAALLVLWWAMHRPRPLAGDELRRLRRAAETIHREQSLPFD